MKISIITIMSVLILVGLVSAVDIFSGDDYTFMSEEFKYYEVLGNSSDVDGMEVSWNEGNTTISFDAGFKSDNFIILLYNIEKEIIDNPVYISRGGGGGGTRTIYKDRNVTEYETVYVDKIVEGIAEDNIINQTTEIEVDKVPLWLWIIVACLLIIIIFLVVKFLKNDQNQMPKV